MSNAQINTKFLEATDAGTKATILSNVANHYGISISEAYAEVTDETAEHLLDSLLVRSAQRSAF